MRPIPSLIFLQIVVFTLSLMPFLTSIKIKGRDVYLAKNQNYKNCIILLGIVFCVFASHGGDWYHYYPIVDELYHSPDSYTHMELIHVWIISNLSFGNYLLWRTIIWGATFLFIFLSFKKLNEDNLITWSCFICVSLIQVSSGRVYLGTAILFYGFCCIIKPNKRVPSFIRGVFFMLVSLLFHKSIFIFLVASVLALIKVKDWINIVGFVLLPVLAKLFTYVLAFYIVGVEENNAATTYLNSDSVNRGPGEAIYIYSLRFFLFYLFFLSFRYICKSRVRDVYRKVFQYSYNLIYIFLVVLISLTLNHIGSNSISGRVLNALFIPLSIIYSRMIQKNYCLKINLAVFFGLFVIGIYNLLYAFYLQSMGKGV